MERMPCENPSHTVISHRRSGGPGSQERQGKEATTFRGSAVPPVPPSSQPPGPQSKKTIHFCYSKPPSLQHLLRQDTDLVNGLSMSMSCQNFQSSPKRHHFLVCLLESRSEQGILRISISFLSCNVSVEENHVVCPTEFAMEWTLLSASPWCHLTPYYSE